MNREYFVDESEKNADWPKRTRDKIEYLEKQAEKERAGEARYGARP